MPFEDQRVRKKVHWKKIKLCPWEDEHNCLYPFKRGRRPDPEELFRWGDELNRLRFKWQTKNYYFRAHVITGEFIESYEIDWRGFDMERSRDFADLDRLKHTKENLRRSSEERIYIDNLILGVARTRYPNGEFTYEIVRTVKGPS